MLWLCWLLVWPTCTAIIVSTKYGDLEGDTVTLHDDWHSGIQIDTFLSVPYAKPPLGPDRFTNPVEVEPWEGVLQALETGNSCMQINSGDALAWVDEDCLNLHILTPANYTGEPMPVMVYIHGGSFVGGANLWDVGHFLAAQGVVMVVPNYRLGIFGFAYTEDEASPGNMGLRDIAQALHFVQETIADFNGDPGRVTVFGQSAGSCAAGDMIISPETEGLFHQSGLLSGAETAIWSYFSEGHDNLGHLQQVAERHGCLLEDTYAMMDCLREVPASQLSLDSTFNCSVYERSCGSWRPVVDGEGGFIPETPWVLREKGLFHHVPEIIGHNIHDAFSIRLYDRAEFEERIEIVADTYASLYYYETQKEDVGAAFNYQYSPWPHIHDEQANGEGINYLMTDAWYGSPADAQGRYHSTEAPVYFYVFNYVSKERTNHPEGMGSQHNMDLPYVFGEPFRADNPEVNDQFFYNGLEYNDEDREFSYFMLTMYANFAKYGNPSPEPVESPPFMAQEDVIWHQFSSDNLTHMYLGQVSVENRLDYRQHEYAFWQSYMDWVFFRDEGRDEDH